MKAYTIFGSFILYNKSYFNISNNCQLNKTSQDAPFVRFTKKLITFQHGKLAIKSRKHCRLRNSIEFATNAIPKMSNGASCIHQKKQLEHLHLRACSKSGFPNALRRGKNIAQKDVVCIVKNTKSNAENKSHNDFSVKDSALQTVGVMGGLKNKIYSEPGHCITYKFYYGISVFVWINQYDTSRVKCMCCSYEPEENFTVGGILNFQILVIQIIADILH